MSLGVRVKRGGPVCVRVYMCVRVYACVCGIFVAVSLQNAISTMSTCIMVCVQRHINSYV